MAFSSSHLSLLKYKVQCTKFKGVEPYFGMVVLRRLRVGS